MSLPVQYDALVPKLWSDTIDAHRRDVRSAILDAAWALAIERGVTAVKMAHVAERTGIGRATLYKYFPDVESMLIAHHERHMEDHLEQLAALRDGDGDVGERLKAVLRLYAGIAQARGQHAPELMTLVHRGEPAAGAQQQLIQALQALLTEAAEAGQVRSDVPVEELAGFGLHALSAARGLKSKAAVERLVDVTMAGLRAPR
jgi:AcrR family transcriptional regulator